MMLDEWIAEEVEALQAFRRMWRERQKHYEGYADKDELYPEHMPHGEWDEQYRLWEPGTDD